MTVSVMFQPLAVKQVQPNIESEITSNIRKASNTSGTSFELMMASAKIESCFKSDAKASSSSASGLFQFTEQTWLDTVRHHGADHGLSQEASEIVDHCGKLTTADAGSRKRILDMRNDPSIASALAGDHMHDLSATLSTSLGRAVTAGEIYLGHFLGAHGAKQMLTAPTSQAAADVLPNAARANAGLFYAADGTPFTTGQFLRHIRDQVSAAVSGIGALNPGTQSPTSAKSTEAAAASSTGSVASGAGELPSIRGATETQIIASLIQAFTHGKQDELVAKNRHATLGTTISASTLTALQMAQPVAETPSSS